MDNKEKLEAKKAKVEELIEVKKKLESIPFAAKKDYFQEKIQEGILDDLISTKTHIEDVNLHISTLEKELILDSRKHLGDFHVEEKQVGDIIKAVNAGTAHSSDETLHFDDIKQKKDVLALLFAKNEPIIITTVGGGGGPGSTGAAISTFIALTDTADTMGSTNQILAVTAGGVLDFTSNPLFATVTSSSHISSTTGNINALAGSSTIYGSIISENGDIRAENGYIRGKHQSANGYDGQYTSFIAGGYINYFEDGLLIYQGPV